MGYDQHHPDFLGRSIVANSFIANEDAQDLQGHGTHCLGTACGALQPQNGRRYGCAHRADIFVGKVLNNAGWGTDGGILAGIQWAVSNSCRIISMSLGSAATPGESYSRVYENIARRALAQNTLIIAAAGNESDRPHLIAPVGRPANCPSILAVGAVDSRMKVARFSCGGTNAEGGKVDIAGPGVGILSSWPMPVGHKSISGTSMATPHVAGIAALHLQTRGLGTSGGMLWQILISTARKLTLPPRDVGSGLVQAP